MSKGKESSVKVGLRVRPLVSKENGQNITISDYDHQSLQFKGQTFTFDHVFGMDVSQVDLYTETAAPMLRSYLDGYNCTIMAYGQTGSGKTFTMGTSDLNDIDSESNQGLIPRFVNDLFENLKNNLNNGSEKTSYKIKASFLEIYGEDVYDLIGISSPSMARVSLPVREDEGGRVFVQGQNEVEVGGVEAALEVLCSGTHNRITASTAMNAGSSRSHAVFTLTLEQSVQSVGSPDDLHVMTSKLTFVDLAGSERIKRTGAEGQRMKEGIQINSGLFNLGQVINSLADEQKLKSGVKSHVPYRNSKLTHLLKDALGGNSQTLFLACVSPAESNESETQSTLSYARQARNIQNKPVKNVDKMQVELRRLKYAVKAWMMKAVTSTFGSSSNNKGPSAGAAADAAGPVTPCKGSRDEWLGCDEAEDLMNRPDVIEFINAMNASISDRLHINEPSPRKVRLSVTGAYSPSPAKNRPILLAAKRGADLAAVKMQPLKEDALLPAKGLTRADSAAANAAAHADEEGMDGILSGLGISSELQDPEETERLVSRMLDMVSKEREAFNSENTHPNSLADADELQAVRDSEILEVEQEIVEKEAILSKLMEQVKGYAAMKADFEKLLEAMHSLEVENKDLETELEQAKRVAEANKQNGKYTAANHAEVERIRERCLKVQNELKTLKSEKTAKESTYKKMVKDSKQCDALLSDIHKLKEEKVNMLKQNKLQAAQFAKLKKDQNQKIGFFKKADIKKRQDLNKLKSELITKERILLHKEREINRVTLKLKASEEHITSLLKLQAAKNKSKMPTVNAPAKPAAGQSAAAQLTGSLKAGLTSAEQEYLSSTKNLVDNIVLDMVERKQDAMLYAKKSAYLKQLNKQLLSEAYELDELIFRKRSLFKELTARYDPAAGAAPAAEAPEDPEEEDDDADMNTFYAFDFSAAASTGKKAASAKSSATAVPTPMKVLFNKISDEDKYAVQQLKLCLALVEGSIGRLNKTIDLYNGDIDELSLRIQERGAASLSTADASIDQLSSWELLSKDLVLNLSLPQCQSLLLDTIGDRCTALAQGNAVTCEMMRLSSENSLSADKLADLNRFVVGFKGDAKARMDAIEKTNAANLWNAVNNAKGSDNVAVKVAVERANELERKLRDTEASAAALASENKENAASINQLSSKVADLSMVLKQAEGPAESGGDTTYLDQLMVIWNKVGLSAEERQEILSYVNNAKKLARSRVVMDAEANLVATIDEAFDLAGKVGALQTAMGKSWAQCVDDEGAVEVIEFLLSQKAGSIDATALPVGASLTATLGLLGAAQTQLLAEFESSAFPALRSIKDKVMEILSEMFLSIGELPAVLQPLMRITLTKDGESAANRAHRIAAQLNSLRISLAGMPVWEGEVQRINLTRLQLVNQLITLRDDTVKLSIDLNMCDPKQLHTLVGSGASEAAETSPEVMNMAVQLIAANSASNPPGSQKLLAAIQHIKLVLDSVKVNRTTVCRLVGQYVQRYQTEFCDATLLVTNNREALVASSLSPAGTFSTLEVSDLFTVAEDVYIHTLQNRKELESYLTQTIFEMTSGSQDAIKYQIISLLNGKMHSVTSPANPARSSLSSFNGAISELMEELSGMAMFLEEAWIQDTISDIVKKWDARIVDGAAAKVDNSLKTIMNENWWLREELTRLTALSDAHKELLRADASLAAHVVEMEEFEIKSKQDRAKALSGNSKLLIEEEKFRKMGKKKYENITDKMLQVFQKLSVLTAAASSSSIEVKIDHSQLSASGQALLKDKKFKEKIELMHLKVSAN